MFRDCFFRHLFLLFPILTLLGIVAPAAPPKDEGPNAEARLTLKVRYLLEKQDFTALEGLAQRFRRGDLFIDGSWKLPVFYNAFDPSGISLDETIWLKQRQGIESWIRHLPQSSTPRIALANWWIAYAAKARGNGWADAVSPKEWKAMKERLAIAENLLQQSENLKPVCPGRFQMMQRVARGMGWDTPKYEALFTKALEKHPTYTPFYLEGAIRLLPRWDGKSGDWERFSIRGNSAALFARIVWMLSPYYRNIFSETEARWEPMKEGFENLCAEYPDSDWILNAYARFACIAGDRKTAKALFLKLSGRYVQTAWPSITTFNELETWANEKKP